MSTVLLLGDVHLSDKPPSACTDSYEDDLFDLLYQTVQLAKKNHYAAVVQAGDLFHVKTPSRTSHRLVQRTIDLVQQYPCPFFVVPGNHDLSNDRLETVNSSQPLGVVLRSGAHMLLGWADQNVESLSLPLYGVPWIQVWNDRRPEGGPSAIAMDVVRDALVDWDTRCTSEHMPALIVTHAPFYPPGLELEFEYFPTSVFADVMGNHGSVYYGHVHERYGQYTVNGVTFCNNGALSRGSLHEYNMIREIAVTEWDTETGQFMTVPLQHKPAAEVFRMDEVTERVTVQLGLDEFLTSVNETSIEITNVESVLEHIRTLQLGSAAELLITELLEKAAST